MDIELFPVLYSHPPFSCESCGYFCTLPRGESPIASAGVTL
jgi:hypothetical protein